MKAVIATDSFKGSCSSIEAGEAIKEGILRTDRNADITVIPIADGGEGTTEALTYGMGGQMQSISVTGPLGNPVCAKYGIIGDRLAVMEMGAAAGLTLVEEDIKGADIVITGEGKLDSQTVMGKAPVGVAELAKKYDKPVIAFTGSAAPDAKVCNEHGIDAYFPVIREITTLDEAMNPETAKRNLTDTAEQVFRLIHTWSNKYG
ncbi:MAG: glycerate kinase [Lachnospiraceae bacterium]|nr:glycerate kinase [Lachnospiraceae bacterium]